MFKLNIVKIGWRLFIVLLSLPGMIWAGNLFVDPAAPFVEDNSELPDNNIGYLSTNGKDGLWIRTWASTASMRH